MQWKHLVLAASLACPTLFGTDAAAGSITLEGSVTACEFASESDCTFPVGTPTVTHVIFDHTRVDTVGRHSYPIGQLNGALTIQIGWMTQTEQDDFFYWNDLEPWSPRHGWYNPDLVFEDGLLAGLDFHSGFDDDMALRVAGSFDFYAGIGSSGTLATELPKYLPEPGTAGLLGLGLAGLGMTGRRRRSVRVSRS